MALAQMVIELLGIGITFLVKKNTPAASAGDTGGTPLGSPSDKKPLLQTAKNDSQNDRLDAMDDEVSGGLNDLTPQQQ
jgi:hypothetical protein